jgi:hypothetical protein
MENKKWPKKNDNDLQIKLFINCLWQLVTQKPIVVKVQKGVLIQIHNLLMLTDIASSITNKIE